MVDMPEGSVVITPAQVYEKVTTLTDVVTKLVVQNESAEQVRVADKQLVRELEQRLSAVERKLWMAAGAAATLGGTLGAYLPSILGQ